MADLHALVAGRRTPPPARSASAWAPSPAGELLRRATRCPAAGTVLAATFWHGRAGAGRAGGRAHPAARPARTSRGDGYAVRRDRRRGYLLLVSDGLGHGPLAARRHRGGAGRVPRRRRRSPPAALLARAAPRACRTPGAPPSPSPTLDAGGRPAAPTPASATSPAGSSARRPQPRAGVACPASPATTCRTVRECDYPLEPGAWLVMHSDGLTDKWDVADYPGLLAAPRWWSPPPCCATPACAATTPACWSAGWCRDDRATQLLRRCDVARASTTSSSSGSAAARWPPRSASTSQDQVRVATALSEVARDAARPPAAADVSFALDRARPAARDRRDRRPRRPGRRRRSAAASTPRRRLMDHGRGRRRPTAGDRRHARQPSRPAGALDADRASELAAPAAPAASPAAPLRRAAPRRTASWSRRSTRCRPQRDELRPGQRRAGGDQPRRDGALRRALRRAGGDQPGRGRALRRARRQEPASCARRARPRAGSWPTSATSCAPRATPSSAWPGCCSTPPPSRSPTEQRHQVELIRGQRRGPAPAGQRAARPGQGGVRPDRAGRRRRSTCAPLFGELRGTHRAAGDPARAWSWSSSRRRRRRRRCAPTRRCCGRCCATCSATR